MSSAIHAKLLTNRRACDRAGVGRASTILHDQEIPINIVIEDLSSGGCRVSGDLGLAMDDTVTVGLPGIGACPAQVVWSDNGSTGLVFRRALTGHDVDVVRANNMSTDGRFGPIAIAPEPADEDRRHMLSPRRRLAIIIAAAICAWGIAIMLFWLAEKLI
jgi:hypothetical protein